ncbi:50S ribosomal protein L5 [Candidatus Woesearchaeota archaeon]|nr:50S ribosomal protein L5 [Candidatus Woesearchaeota archaeon]
MQQVRIEKLTLNIGAGKEQTKLDKGVALIKHITGIDPVKTVTQKRIAAWGLRPGLPIGCKLTIRGKKAAELLGRLLQARDMKLAPTQIDDSGNLSFGIPEYIDIPGVAYDPKIGVMGMEACVTFAKPGYHVKKRRVRPAKIGRKHRVTREETITFLKDKYNVSVEVATN